MANFSIQSLKRSTHALVVLSFAFLLSASVILSGCTGNGNAGSFFEFKNPSAFSADTPEQAKAIALYDEVWQLIANEYVDGRFNGQNWNEWRHRYDKRMKDLDDSHVAIQTMLSSLNDVYTRYLNPRDMNEQNLSIDSRLFGIGIQISKKDEKLAVVSIFDDTPASRAKLMPKDVITKINGNDTKGMSVEDAADQIRGKEGTLVTLNILRGSQELVKKIPRAEIKIKSVFTKAVEDPNIGYIRLNSFISETALTEMLDAAGKMEDKKALILDLRGNYGGLLMNAVEMADMFLENGDIVSVVDREQDKNVYRAKPGTMLNQPMVVLVDGGSASASEILSGALKDHNRATLIGTHTFGKGLVQKINMLSDGSGLNITISKYLTPNGTDINKKGIEPQIEVHYTPKDFYAGKDPQLSTAIKFLKKQYHI